MTHSPWMRCLMSADAQRPAGTRTSPWVFVAAFLRHAKTIGAVSPTSRRVANRIAQLAHAADARTLAEFGSGTGAITAPLLAAMAPDARLWGFEVYAPFAERLQATISDPRFTLLTDSAETIGQVQTGAGAPGFDAIVSSIPFSLLSAEETHRIIDAAARALRPGAPFIALQYHPFYLGPYLRQHFDTVSRHVSPWNVPPVTLFRARNARTAG